MNLTEVMIATTTNALIVGALITSGVTLQRSTVATEHYAEAQASQSRIADLLDVDLRRAMNVQVGANGNICTIWLPDYYDSSGNAREPTLVNNRVVYGDPTQPAVVTYFRRDDTIVRREYAPAIGRLIETVIARDVEDFDFEFTSERKTVSTSATFIPRFSRWSNLVDRGILRSNTTFVSQTFLRNYRLPGSPLAP